VQISDYAFQDRFRKSDHEFLQLAVLDLEVSRRPLERCFAIEWVETGRTLILAKFPHQARWGARLGTPKPSQPGAAGGLPAIAVIAQSGDSEATRNTMMARPVECTILITYSRG
jgi:hypothetical protein